jgi:hypothetical protein
MMKVVILNSAWRAVVDSVRKYQYNSAFEKATAEEDRISRIMSLVNMNHRVFAAENYCVDKIRRWKLSQIHYNARAIMKLTQSDVDWCENKR